MNQENGKTVTAAAPVEMYRVKRASDGMYLCVEKQNGLGEFNLRWWHPMQNNVFQSQWPFSQSVVIAATMRVLTGDHSYSGIDVEAVAV